MAARIIVPLDQSAIAESVLPLARMLSGQLGARVTLLSVLDVPPSLGHYERSPERSHASEDLARRSGNASPDSPYGTWEGWSSNQPSAKQIEDVASQTAAAERYLSAIAETFPADGAAVEEIVRFGRPAERILESAESRDNAMIVLASHGRSGLGRAVVGSVAARVVQAATSPVFVVRARRGGRGAVAMEPIKKILAPVDGSAFAERTLPIVEQNFGDSGTHAQLLYVVEQPRYANQAQAEEYVKWLAKKVDEGKLTADYEVREGSPAACIIEAAKDQDADLIAMSTHGRSGLDRFVLGSVAERVLHEADRPLMLIPARMK
jgi:nucleotide-binding universal stress UspA family protein